MFIIREVIELRFLFMDPELEAFLKDNKEFQLNDHGKVYCNLTNHDIVATMAEVKKHMQTEKYQHAKDW